MTYLGGVLRQHIAEDEIAEMKRCLPGACRTARLPHKGEGPWPPHSPPPEPAAGHRSINSPSPRAAKGQVQGPPRGLGRSSRRGRHPKYGPETHLGRPGQHLAGMRHIDSTDQASPKPLAELNWGCLGPGEVGQAH